MDCVAGQRRGEFSISGKRCSGRSTCCFGCDACAARSNLVGVALFFVTAGSAGGDLLVSAVVMPFVRALPWAGRASPVRVDAAGVTREVQSELVVIVARRLQVPANRVARPSADRAYARVGHGLHESPDGGYGRGVGAGVQASLRGLGGKTVDNFMAGSRRFEYPLHTVLRRRFPVLGSDTLDDRFALHNPHGDSPGGGRAAPFIGRPPTGLVSTRECVDRAPPNPLRDRTADTNQAA